MSGAYHRNVMPGETMPKKSTMLAKVLHIVPRAFLEQLAKDYVGGEASDRPWVIARPFLEGRIVHHATPEMREQIAHFLHGELCPPCVQPRGVKDHAE